ncbi:MAG: tRNA pseudouridine(55) synthase TruB [Pseudomonadota bacterium]
MKSGIIAVHKPEGLSSARVVARVKKVLNAKKVGHTGTLDPFATGLLLCAINHGTKLSQFFLGGDKRYTARVHLGIETDTYDRTGQIVSTATQATMDAISIKAVQAVVNSFFGVQEQIPPVYSALKHNGQPLYKLARQGSPVQKPARRIEIFDIAISRIDLPYIDLEVFCSTGTYIRSIAYDIGIKLGCGAHLAELCRTQSSSFMLDRAIDLETLENLSQSQAEDKIVPLTECLEAFPKVTVDSAVARKIGYGQKLFTTEMDFIPQSFDQFIRVVDDQNALLAIVQLPENSQTYNYSCVFLS